jgi:Holliday junction resolvasome RuvABC endonuclease subunit
MGDNVTAGDLMTERLVRVETKLDTLLTRYDPQMIDMETRMRALERARSTAIGWAMGAGAVAGIAMQFLLPLLQK